MRMKVLMMCPDPLDITSFYRAYGPLSLMARHNLLDLQIAREVNHLMLRKHDLLFFQRPCDPTHIAVCKMAKDWGTPIVVEFDDLVDEVHVSNPAYFKYQRIKDYCIASLKIADKIIVSTDFIRDRWETKYPWSKGKFVVIPNAIDDAFLTPHWMPEGRKRRDVISWRGSVTHEYDLLGESRRLFEMMEKNPGTEFVFMGSFSPIISSFKLKNVVHLDFMDFPKYMHNLMSVAPKAHLVPLANTAFNHAKSNIAWIEATWAGARTLVSPSEPSFKEFMRPGMGSLDDIESGNQKESWEYIMDELVLSKQNKKRAEVFEEVLSG